MLHVWVEPVLEEYDVRLNNMTYAKAIAPVVVGGIILVLSYVGIAPDMTVEQALTVLVQSGLASVAVFFTRNKTV